MIRGAILSVLILLFGATMLAAGPLPPVAASPEAKAERQRVDEAGCIHMRAVYGDRVLWVPQMRDGRPHCPAAESGEAGEMRGDAGDAVPPDHVPPVAERGVADTGDMAEETTRIATAIAIESAVRAAVDAARDSVVGDAARPAIPAPPRRPWGAHHPTRHHAAARRATVQQAPAQPVMAQVDMARQTASVEASSTPRGLIQVGTYRQHANAEGAVARLRTLGLPARRTAAGDGGFFVVYAGPFFSRDAMTAALRGAQQAGFADAFPVR